MVSIYDIVAEKAFKKDYSELVAFEIAQFKKAFADGTKKGWATYRANVRRRVTILNKKYGVFIDADALMNS